MARLSGTATLKKATTAITKPFSNSPPLPRLWPAELRAPLTRLRHLPLRGNIAHGDEQTASIGAAGRPADRVFLPALRKRPCSLHFRRRRVQYLSLRRLCTHLQQECSARQRNVTARRVRRGCGD